MLSSQVYEELLGSSTALLVDAKCRLGLPESHLDAGIKPVVPFTKMAGSAVTVRLEEAPEEKSADLSLLTRTYEAQAPGSNVILVIQVPEQLHAYGIVGGGGATIAGAHGFTGVLVEGAARDSHELQEMQFPVFSRVVSPGYIVGKTSAVAANEPVRVGGRTIHSGDIIVGDNDGVIAIRPHELNDCMAKAEAIKQWEHLMHTAFAAGKTADQAKALAGPMP